MDVAAREALHLRELSTKIGREPVDDSPAPALLLLALEDLIADTPVEPDQLLVNRECGTRARSTDLSLEASTQLGIALRKGRSGKGLTADHCLHYARTWLDTFRRNSRPPPRAWIAFGRANFEAPAGSTASSSRGAFRKEEGGNATATEPAFVCATSRVSAGELTSFGAL